MCMPHQRLITSLDFTIALRNPEVKSVRSQISTLEISLLGAAESYRSLPRFPGDSLCL
jgi:hypothetical protein